MSFCDSCKSFKPRGKNTPLFCGGWWMGDGKCENPDAWSESEYPFPKPHNVTVTGSSCEFHDPLKKDYVIIAQTAPDGKIVNKEYSHGIDKESALSHYSRLKNRGWRVEIELREI